MRSQQALRESEERLRALFSQSAAGIGQTDLSVRMVLVNQRFCKMLGYRSDELVGIRFQDITHPEDLAEAEQQFKRLLSTGEPFEMEKRCVKKDGSLVWTAISVSALRGDDGRIRQVGFIAIDISASKDAQELNAIWLPSSSPRTTRSWASISA